MLKVIGDFSPYGAEFIDAYPHLVERSQSFRSSNDVDFSKLLDTAMKRNTTSNTQSTQTYQLSSVPWSTLKNTTESHQILSVPQNAFPVDEELYVRNNTVIWSRGRHIIKSFQYELQSVEKALFAWFPVEQLELENEDPLITDSNFKRKMEFEDEQPFKKKRQTVTSLNEAGACSSIPMNKNDTADIVNNTEKALQKAVCILLKDCMKIHFMDGKHYSIPLPFTTRQVIPSDIGLIFERANYNSTNTINKRSKNNDSFADYTKSYAGNFPLSTVNNSTNHLKASPFLCLVHPSEDLKPIFFLEDLSQPSFLSLAFGPNFFQQQQLIYASFTMDYTDDNDSQLPTLVVTKSKDTGLHTIWRYQVLKYSEMDSSDEDALDEETNAIPFYVNMEDQQRQSKQEQTSKIKKSSKRAKKSSYSTKNNKRKQQQQQQQQSSPPSPHGGVPYHSASPSPSLTTRKDSFLAASLSFIQNDDDISNIHLDGNGDSYSMMALYQDALDTQKGEKCLLQPIWKEQRQSSRLNRSTVSKGFISHNAKGLAMLCILNETEGTLLGLVINDLLSRGHSKASAHQQENPALNGFHLAVKQALPVRNAIRSGGLTDILYLDHQNNMFLFVDSQLPSLPILLCTKQHQRQGNHGSRIIKLQDAVDNRFNMVTTVKDIHGMPKYSTKRCQISVTPVDSCCKSSSRILVTNGNMALRCAWSSSLLWFFFQHYSLKLLQEQQSDTFDGWESFVITLMSMIPLSLALPYLSTAAAGTKYDKKVLNFYVQCLEKAHQIQNQHQEKGNIYYISDPRDIASMIYALHILYQEWCLSKFISKETLVLLGTLLWAISQIVRSDRWIDFYREYGSSQGISYQLDTSSLQHYPPTNTAVYEEELVFLNHPFHFESWVHYHLPHDSTTSLQQLCGVPTLDPDTVYLPVTSVGTTYSDVTAPPSNNNKIQCRHGEFGFKLKMIWYVHQTMYRYLPDIGSGSNSSVPSNLHTSSLSRLPSNMALQEWIKSVMKKGYCRNDLEMVPDSCILLDPLLNAISQLQLNPPINQSTDFYKFIGRYDMVAQLDYYRVGSTLSNTSMLALYQSKLLQYDKNDHQRHTSNLDYRDSDLILSQPLYGGTGSTLDKLKHVRAMLNSCHLVEVIVPDRPGISQDNLDNIIQSHMKHLIQRTLSLSMGNGIFHYGHQHLSHLPSSNMNNNHPAELSLMGNSGTIPGSGNRSLASIEEKMCMSAKLLPLRTVVTLDEKTYRPEYYNWPRFHHGVATGLRLSSPRISPSNKDRNDNELRQTPTLPSNTGYLDDGLLGDDKNDLCWLFYVEPEELNVFHGGLIFGLGLNGHLLPNSRWYRYITQTKCSLVTIGFILGTCVTFRGTKNSEITKILSVHVPALLNPSATTATTATAGAINAAYGISTSSNHRIRGEDALMTSCCLFGFGLVYMGSCDRYMISVMLNEIGNCSKRANSNQSTGINGDISASSGTGQSSNSMESACALAAGFALGFIALGKGGNVSKELGGLSDAQLSDTLYNYITGQSPNTNNTKSSPPTSAPSTSTANLITSLNRYQSSQRTERKYPHGEGTNGQHYNRSMPNLLDITAPAATVAMGLIYLKTENHRMAERLDICETTRPYLNYVRPDFLLIRIVAKNLILWKSITPSQAWIDNQLPIFMRPLHKLQRDTDCDDIRSSTPNASMNDTDNSFSTPAWEDQVINQAKYNVIAGACLCLGLRFAGSHDSKAFECLLSQFDFFMNLAAVQATSFQEQITRSAIWVCIDVIATAAAMTMAGSGHEGLYRRLKVLHDRIPFGNVDTASNNSTNPSNVNGATGQGNYGDHTASHMAMGLLFCGLGRYTLKTTNEAIAGLLCAFYPFYPLDPEDQRSHLQAFRHLWVIGMDQRWLTPFDCDTKLPCQVPLLITTTSSSSAGYIDSSLKNYYNTGNNSKEALDLQFDDIDNAKDDLRSRCAINLDIEKTNIDKEENTKGQQELNRCRVVAPSIVPNYDCIQNIQLDSSLYYPLSVDMQTKGDYQQAICQSGILFVQKRRNDSAIRQ